MASRGRTGFKAVGLLALVACGAPAARPVAAVEEPGDEVWLYRDEAAVQQRIEVSAPAPGKRVVPVVIAADDVAIGDLVVDAAPALNARLTLDGPAPREGGALRVRLIVDAPAGRSVVKLGYATTALSWRARYTVTRSGDTGAVRGELALRNRTRVALTAHVRVIDDTLGARRSATRDSLRKALAGASDLPARDLGRIATADGARGVLIAGPRRLRPALVLDAVGHALDHPGAAPATEPALGARTTRVAVTDCVEVAREPTDRGLPGGDVELIERGQVIGRGRIYEAVGRLARGETIAVGEARGLVGVRERRGWDLDDDRRRLSEEFLVTIESVRNADSEVLVREHLYRGENWTLAYQSAPAGKEGAQQIGLRAVVPANGQAKVLYVVVYTW
jgi:hypothetical protein